MKKLSSEEVLLLAVLTISIVFLWVFFSVKKISTGTNKPVVTTKEVMPINPKLDLSVLDELEKRK